MTFEEKLANQEYDRIWQEYCGFLDLDMESYMRIQRRLLEEQIRLWSSSPLGQKILKGRTPSNVEEFRSMVPLTTYEDYADVLLLKKEDMRIVFIGGQGHHGTEFLHIRRSSAL